MKFHVPEMSCGHCTAAIAREIATLDPGAQVTADLETRTVDVATTHSAGSVAQAIKAAGYDADLAA